jgi:hypothetical protein
MGIIYLKFHGQFVDSIIVHMYYKMRTQTHIHMHRNTEITMGRSRQIRLQNEYLTVVSKNTLYSHYFGQFPCFEIHDVLEVGPTPISVTGHHYTQDFVLLFIVNARNWE